MRKIEVEGGEGGQIEGGGTTAATEGRGGKEGGGKSGGITLKRGRTCRKKAQGRKK